MPRQFSSVSRRRFLQSSALGAAAFLHAPAVLRAQGAAVKVGVLHPVSGALSYSGQQGRLGAVIFEGNGPGRCNCTYGSNYPYAVGPRIGVAYQIDRKTVLRVGAGLSFGPNAENAQISYNIGQAVNVLAPGYGLPAWPSINAAGNQLAGGNPFRPGNPYGNATITWPNFDPGQYPSRSGTGAATLLVPSTPLTGSFDRNMGRPPRILSWSFGLQREVTRDLVVEAMVPNPERLLLPGMFADVALTVGSQRLPSVPAHALSELDEQSRVFVVAAGRLEERVVALGPKQDGQVSIVRGVNDGEQVVVSDVKGLSNGRKVR